MSLVFVLFAKAISELAIRSHLFLPRKGISSANETKPQVLPYIWGFCFP